MIKKMLFISGSLGLGHISRDLAIAKELRILIPGIEIYWLAAHPADIILKEANEILLPEADNYANDNVSAENAAGSGQLNLLKYLSKARKEWAQNVNILKDVTKRERFDVIVGDETYEILVALMKKPSIIGVPFVMIYDFVGLDSMAKNPLDRLVTYIWNRTWSKDRKLYVGGNNIGLYIGEEEDIPDKRFGMFLPNRRQHAKNYYRFIGYVLPFDVKKYEEKSKIKAKLGYGEEPLVVCSIGGTSIGKSLLELCGRAYPSVKNKHPDLRMVLVCGPRLKADSLKVPNGVEIRQYVPKLYEHFAASDLSIVQAGGTTTLELMAIRRPFLYFPLEGHSEQEIFVAGRLARHKAGIRMSYSQTTPEILAEKIISNIGKNVTYPPISTDGARKAAELINKSQ